MVRGGFRRISNDEFQYKISNRKLHKLCGSEDVSYFVKEQQFRYACHVVRMPLNSGVKQLMFNDDSYVKCGRPKLSLLEQVAQNKNLSIDGLCNVAVKRL